MTHPQLVITLMIIVTNHVFIDNMTLKNSNINEKNHAG
jgi:hypothetical protein